MTGSRTAAADRLLREFDAPWRDDTPVFGCCRKAVAAAVEHTDPLAVGALDVTARVQALRDAVDRELPGHLDTHRCCANHLADLAFDLPELVPAGAEVGVE
jgi:hypothetical protein